MIRQLFVHIGDHKTGSTSIQIALAGNRLKTPGTTIAYPTDRSHNGLAKWISDGTRPEDVAAKMSRLAEVFCTSDADIGVISAEAFEGCPPGRLAEMLNRYLPMFAQSARIIAYVRPHAQRVLSSYAEQIKSGTTADSLRSFYLRSLERQRFIYTPRFESWRAEFGDRFTLRPMVRDLLRNRDVTSDFLGQILGPDAPFTLPPEGRENSSLSLEDLALLRLLHMSIPRQAKTVKHPLGWHLQHLLGQRPADPNRSTRLALDTALATELYEAYREDAGALDASFFEGTPMADSLERDILRTVPEPQSVLAEDHFPPETLRRLQTLAGLLGEAASFTPGRMHGHIRAHTTRALLGHAAPSGPRPGKDRKKKQKPRDLPPVEAGDILDLF